MGCNNVGRGFGVAEGALVHPQAPKNRGMHPSEAPPKPQMGEFKGLGFDRPQPEALEALVRNLLRGFGLGDGPVGASLSPSVRVARSWQFQYGTSEN